MLSSDLQENHRTRFADEADRDEDLLSCHKTGPMKTPLPVTSSVCCLYSVLVLCVWQANIFKLANLSGKGYCSSKNFWGIHAARNTDEKAIEIFLKHTISATIKVETSQRDLKITNMGQAPEATAATGNKFLFCCCFPLRHGFEMLSTALGYWLGLKL